MSKEELITLVKEENDEIIALNTSLEKTKTDVITKKQTKQDTEKVAKTWFEKIEPCCEQFGISEPIRLKYHNLFTELLNLSVKPSRKKTYRKTLQAILADLKEDVLIPIIKSAGKITSISNLSKILENVSVGEREYLNEALGCAQQGFFRASMVMVWSATINRIQKTVEKLGLENFNSKTEEMKKITEGRFKRFRKSYSVHSLS